MTFPELPVPPKLKDHPAIPVLRELYRQATVRGYASQWVCEIANLARDAIDLILTTPAAPQAPVEVEDSDIAVDVVCEAIDASSSAISKSIEEMHETLLRIETLLIANSRGES